MSTEFPHIDEQLDRVRRGAADGVVRAIGDRETQLRQLRRLLVEQESELTAALRADLGKSSFEAYTTEIGFTINEIDLALDQIRSWTKPRRTKLPLHLKPGSAEVVPEPLGTVLIIAPWNYPVQLLLAPLVPAWPRGTPRSSSHRRSRRRRQRRSHVTCPRTSTSGRCKWSPVGCPRPPCCSPSASTTSSTPATAPSGRS
jgi:hypothetical protein